MDVDRVALLRGVDDGLHHQRGVVLSRGHVKDVVKRVALGVDVREDRVNEHDFSVERHGVVSDGVGEDVALNVFHPFLWIQPEVVGVFRQRRVQDALGASDAVKEVQRFVCAHFVGEGQVLAGRGHVKRSSGGVLTKGVDQDDRVLAVLVVEVLVQSGARVELTEVTVRREEVGEVAVVEVASIVDRTWCQRAADEATVL